MKEASFLSVLKDVAKEQSVLGRERLIPEKLSPLANLVAMYLWQTIAMLSLLSTILWSLSKDF